jgi:hypothetical protein
VQAIRVLKKRRASSSNPSDVKWGHYEAKAFSDNDVENLANRYQYPVLNARFRAAVAKDDLE